ncbi:MAG: PIG-L family deacetylase [Eubacteriales bacterium]|nr:PIG-L family deacetylase [Eubacteriales bacterium]
MNNKKKNKKPNTFSCILSSVLLSAELCAIADAALALLDYPVPVWLALLIFVALTLLLSLVSFHRRKAVWKAFISVTSVIVVLAAAAGGIWFHFYRSSVYEDAGELLSASGEGNALPADLGNAPFFSRKNVMLIVPHQDDDLNLLAGSIEKFVAAGSEMRVVYTTNGDYSAENAEIRLNESLRVLGSYGIPEENIIFLGYGDSWKGPVHLYNAPDDEILESRAGFTSVYGTEDHPAWKNGNAYTRSNFISDLKNVILTFRPEVIFCVDCDHHDDHIAASLFFDRIMGQIKKETPDYCPHVYKGFAYGTAYDAEDDFYSLNILSSVPPFDSLGISPQGAYRWPDRVRLPVEPTSLSRSMLSCGTYEKLRMYASQSARFHAGGIINGDKVFWERETTALSYSARAGASSGDASRLNDFMLCDTANIGNTSADIFHAGTWIPEEDDPEKCAYLIFDDPIKIERLCLYDSPSLSDNILEAEITLAEYSDNSLSTEILNEITFLTGPLDPDGHCTEIFPEIPEGMEIGYVSVRIIRSEGDCGGLAELEVYGSVRNSGETYPPEQKADGFIKITDSEDNFVYDYYLSSGEGTFGLYGYQCSADPEDYEITCTGTGCTAYLEDGMIKVECPKGKMCILTVTEKIPEDSGDDSDSSALKEVVSDSVIIRGADPLMKLGQNLEAFVYDNYAKLQQTAIYSILRGIYHLLGGETIIL